MSATPLPRLPSALIRLALGDLAKVEAMPETYRVDMAGWHNPERGKCEVCLAGAVMAMSLRVPPKKDACLGDFDDRTRGALIALDCLQRGWVRYTLRRLGHNLAAGRFGKRRIALYKDDPAAFRRDMERLAADLEAAGL